MISVSRSFVTSSAQSPLSHFNFSSAFFTAWFVGRKQSRMVFYCFVSLKVAIGRCEVLRWKLDADAGVHFCSVFMTCSPPTGRPDSEHSWQPSVCCVGFFFCPCVYVLACVHMVAASEVAPVVHSWHRDSII